MVRSRLTFVVLASVAALALTGCAPAAHSAAPTHSASSTPSTPTPTPGSSALAPAQLVVSADGVGPVVVGEPVSARAALQASIVFNVHHCGLPPGANYPDWESTNLDIPWLSLGIAGTTASDVIDAIEVESPEIATAAGVHVGSSLADLVAAYPTFSSFIRGNGSDLYILRGTDGQLAIEVTSNRTDVYWTPAEVDKVVSMAVYRLDDTPSGFANSDAAVGGCS